MADNDLILARYIIALEPGSDSSMADNDGAFCRVYDIYKASSDSSMADNDYRVTIIG